MLRRVNDVLGLDVTARDGDVGTLSDLYVNDIFWKVHYMIVDVGKWFADKRVLISPYSAGKPFSGFDEAIPLDMTINQAKNSPSFEQATPVSRQFGRNIVDYFRMQWQVFAPGAHGIHTPRGVDLIDSKMIAADKARGNGDEDNNHLRSLKEILLYMVSGDGEIIGRVHDFVVDFEQWKLTNIIVDTNTFLPFGTKKALPVHHIRDIDWQASQINLGISKEQFEELKEFDEERVRTQRLPVDTEQL